MTGHSTFKMIQDKHYLHEKWIFLGKNIHSLKIGGQTTEEVINFVYVGEKILANMLVSPTKLMQLLRILTSKDIKIKTTISANDIVRNLTIEEYKTLEGVLRVNNIKYNKKKNEFIKTDIGNTTNTKQESTKR